MQVVCFNFRRHRPFDKLSTMVLKSYSTQLIALLIKYRTKWQGMKTVASADELSAKKKPATSTGF
jgi:hypothetical protein